MAVVKNIHEILEEFEKASTKQEKIQILQNNATWALKSVLQGAYDPNVHFDIDYIPQYKPMDKEVPADMGYSSIHTELDRVYLYVKDHPRKDPNLKTERIYQILTQALEAMVAPEAAVFANMLTKKPLAKGLTEKLVREAFPGLLSERSRNEEKAKA